MRSSASLLVLLTVFVCVSRDAQAEEPRTTLVVLDRGRDARGRAVEDAALALKLVRALEEQGADVRLLAAGARADGRPELLATTPTKAAIAALSDRRGLDFTGATDPRAFLRSAVTGRTAAEPFDLVLVGPFSAPPEGLSARRGRSRGQAVPDWNRMAPAGSRLLPVGMSEAALATFEGARGLQTEGWLVLGFARPAADPQPFSPLAPAGVRLDAVVSTAAEVVPVGSAGEPPPLLTAATDLADDEVLRTTSGMEQSFRVTRSMRDGRTATMSFRRAEADGVTYLCRAPGPLTFTWDRLAPDAFLQDVDRALLTRFEALDVEADAPLVRTYRLLRTRVGSRPAWQAASDDLPEGLRWSIGTETAVSPDVVEAELRVEFRARAATPLDVEGALVLSADGMPRPVTLPYALRVGPGRASFSLESGSAALPPAAADTPVRLGFRAVNANVPATLPIEATTASDHARWLRGVLRAADGRETPWPLTQALPVPVGKTHEVRIDLLPEAPADLEWPCTLTIRPAATPGVVVEGEGTIQVRLRRPHLVVEGEAPDLVVEDGRPHARTPLVLRLDPDGGDGDWLLRLMRTPPTVTTVAGGIEGWEVVTREPGLWEVRPSGTWQGPRPETFADAGATVRLQVDWPAGAAPEGIEAQVAVPARWGKRGWLFVGLAFLAVVLGVTVFVQMRAPPVSGTLLYLVEDMPGTVGRLDLRPVGRRATDVRADGRGRLALEGDAPSIARILPTRVGGMLEVVAASAERERRLLVDGLSVRAGRHMLRYVSGQPAEAEAAAVMEDVPDILGEEFDIESGRIDAL